MSAAVRSDFGDQTFVDNQRAAHNEELRFAGDNLMSYTDVYSTKATADARIDAINAYQDALPKQDSGGFGGLGGAGKIAGGILGSVIAGPPGGAIGSSLGGLFG